jgi:hypothetical protein
MVTVKDRQVILDRDVEKRIRETGKIRKRNGMDGKE